MSSTADPFTILLAGGGTGGHLYPGIAVAEAMARLMPGARPLFLCTKRPIDRTILAPTGFEFVEQPVVPLRRSVGGLLKFWKAWRETNDLLNQEFAKRKPVAVIGLGGYAAGAAVRLGALRKLPTLILNPDVIPGRANQFLLKSATAGCCQFEATRDHVSSSIKPKLRMTGCPIRRDIVSHPKREEAARRLGLKPILHTLVITGASQGAQTINQATLEVFKTMKTLQGWQILHLAGQDLAAEVRSGYRDLKLDAAVLDFTPAMADVWAVADLAISRAGASSCAELTACGVPSILLPYPFHKDMHQRANASVLADGGAAVLLNDEIDRAKNAADLRPALEALLYDAPRRQAMATAARTLGKPDAADRVVEELRQIIPAGR